MQATMQGLHLTADLYRCQRAPHWLTNATALLLAVEQAATAVGLPVLGRLLPRLAVPAA